MNAEEMIRLALDTGFDHAGNLNVERLDFRQEVRDMCASGQCGNYGKCWTCPPYCGTLEESREKAAAFSDGILVQTTGLMEDDFDYESIREAESRHKDNFLRLVKKLRSDGMKILPMGAGGCRICKACSCPEESCRHPEDAIVSMEAYGLMVLDTCKASGMEYNYGPRTLTFTSAVLFGSR